MNKRTQIALLFLLSAFLVWLTGCSINLSIGADSFLTGESYPDAEKYQTGSFTYNANEIEAVEVYWRSGNVEIIESDNAELSVKESGSMLPENKAMHFLLDNGVLRIRFCASGESVQLNSSDKHLSLEVPKGISISVHTTSASVKADTLEQNDILIAVHSGNIKLGTVTAESTDFSSSSGSIRADSTAAQSLKCSASSGAVDLGVISVRQFDCSTSSGAVTVDSVTSETISIAATSGKVTLELAEVSAGEIRTSSGKVDLTLAKDGAEILYTAASGKLLTDSICERKGDLYVFGSGASKLTVETSSGNLEIKQKGMNSK